MRPAPPTMPAKAPPKPPNSNGSTPTQQAVRPIGTSKGLRSMGRKMVVYGPGGIGKSKLVSLLEQLDLSMLFFDVEEGTSFLDVSRAEPTPATFAELRAALQNRELVDQFDGVCIDSLTKVEEYATAHVLATVPHEKGHKVERIEDYGFGKGYTHIYEAMLLMLQDLDAIARRGKHVVCICHDCTENVPNPAGENYLQFQPRLQSPPKAGKVRERAREWCDDLIYIGWDLIVSKDGKAQGGGSRTIYPVQYATHWAKSRTLSEPTPYNDNDPAFWHAVFNTKGNE